MIYTNKYSEFRYNIYFTFFSTNSNYESNANGANATP